MPLMITSGKEAEVGTVLSKSAQMVILARATITYNRGE